MAGGAEFNPFQMEDGQVLVVGGHDDQGVLDAVELINLTSSEVGACLTFCGEFIQNQLEQNLMPGDRNANHGVSQPTLGWFLLASRWQPTGERGPITKLSKWVTCMIIGHMHDNRLTSGWRNDCSSHRTMPILSHIHVHEKIHSYTDTHRWVEEWMGCSSRTRMPILSPTPPSIGRWVK